MREQLAEVLGIGFFRFDMSEYMEKHSVSRLIGAPPGYVGFDQGGLLTEAINQTPHAVLLLDEIEKAHPDLHSVLLQVMDHGTLTDTNGRKVDFRNVVIIMTTNAGAQELSHGGIGFEGGLAAGEVSSAVKESFSPEFRNRLDAIVPFGRLPESVVESVVDKFINQLNLQLKERGVHVHLEPAARRFLAKEGYDPAFGARPLARVIQEKIKSPLSEEILFGKLAKGGQVKVSCKKDKLAFSFSQIKVAS